MVDWTQLRRNVRLGIKKPILLEIRNFTVKNVVDFFLFIK